MPGHLFIVRGDIRRLASDAWLMPCDERAKPRRQWTEHLPKESRWPGWPTPKDAWLRGEQRAMRVADWPAGLSRPWLGNVGAGGAPIDWYVAGAVAFVEAAAAKHAGDAPRNGRARHLFAVPVVGTGGGGAGHVVGDVLRRLVPALRDAARRLGVDVARVEGDSGSESSEGERDEHWDEVLDEPLREKGAKLAEAAARGDLVFFLGAGVSRGAGLPDWAELLERLARVAPFTGAEVEALSRLHPLDQARLVELRLQQRAPGGDARVLGRAVVEALGPRAEHALAHGLLSGFPVNEVVTTNYDDLFELASVGAGRKVSVLPHAPASDGSRWILKMHGCVRHPDDIVLTREDYLRYADRRQALAGIVQALLLTRQMLFVGFSLNDDNFHRIADAVRRARVPTGDRHRETAMDRFGTALVLSADPLLEALWMRDLDWVAMRDSTAALDPASRSEAARRLDIFLDYVLAHAQTSARHLLDERYEGALSSDDAALSRLLRGLTTAAKDDPAARRAPAWARVERLLRELGWDD